MRFIYPIFLFVAALSFGSCSSYSYFYSVMDTNDPYTYKNEKGEFVLPGDSIDIIYSFYGENAPVTVGVYNKMSKPVYIDWRRSGVVIDGTSTTFRAPIEVYAARGDTGSVDFGRFLNDPKGLGFVKPNSRLNTQVLELSDFNFHKIPDEKFEQHKTKGNIYGENSKYGSIIYDEENSPIFIGTFLTLYETANNMEEPILYETDFYMFELIKGGNKDPFYTDAYKDRRGDFFYVRRGENVQKKKNSKWRKFGNSSLKVLDAAASVAGNIVVWALDGRGTDY